jgi:hypothetical protein
LVDAADGGLAQIDLVVAIPVEPRVRGEALEQELARKFRPGASFLPPPHLNRACRGLLQRTEREQWREHDIVDAFTTGTAHRVLRIVRKAAPPRRRGYALTGADGPLERREPP